MVEEVKKNAVLGLFKKIDKDNNGYLDRYEIRSAIEENNINLMELLGMELTDKHIDQLIASSDKNSDGKIQIDEFVTLMSSIAQIIPDSIDRLY